MAGSNRNHLPPLNRKAKIQSTEKVVENHRAEKMSLEREEGGGYPQQRPSSSSFLSRQGNRLSIPTPTSAGTSPSSTSSSPSSHSESPSTSIPHDGSYPRPS